MENAADALDQIREGGQKMILAAQSKLADCRSHLEKGDFMGAHDAAEALMDRLGSLAHAQAHLARVADKAIVSVGDAEVGMVTEGGEIVGLDPCPCGREECRKRVVRFANGGEVVLPADAEFVVGTE